MQPDDPISISALQHYSYCPRQCALIHVEQTFDENLYTLRGRAVHERVDCPEANQEGSLAVERALPLFSTQLGLTGKADLVEVRPDGSLYPVEYKHGPNRVREHDDIQLAAQCMCLEEMTGTCIEVGAIFHHSSRRRREVKITSALRHRVRTIIGEIRTMLASSKLPPPVNDERCRHCSLFDACQPHAMVSKLRQRELHDQLFSTGDGL